MNGRRVCLLVLIAAIVGLVLARQRRIAAIEADFAGRDLPVG
ncbi:MAG: hypothetical protein AAGK32_08080 [Actinomycetota bacterium]